MIEGKLRKLARDLGIEVIHKNSKGWLIAPCPFAPFTHEFGSDRNASFNLHVNPSGYSGFKCFTCGHKGNLTKLVNTLADMREEDYQALAVRALIDETPEEFIDFDEVDYAKEDYKEISPLEATIYLRMYPMASETPKAIAYLKKRGITRQAAELLDLRYDSDQERILFPVYDWDKKLYGFTGRTVVWMEKYTKNYPKVRDYAGLPKDRVLLGEHLSRDGLPMLVVEGLFALAHVISLGVCEFCNPVATMGSSMSEAQRDLLIDHEVPIFMLYDWDHAGKEGLFGTLDGNGNHEGGGALDLLKGEVPTYRCLFPEDLTDPDDLTLEDVKQMVLGDSSELV